MAQFKDRTQYKRALKRWENEGGTVSDESNEDDIGLKIWTIGHSTRDAGAFLALLDRERIEVVADVRTLPGSRKYPQFNAEELSATLSEHGIEYIPFKQLGGRRRARKDSPNTAWRHPAFRGYADYMETEEFEKGIEELLAIAGRKPTAIMCSEAVWWRCHRSMISDRLKSQGVLVEHIMDGKDVIHPYTSAARILHGRLVYGDGTLGKDPKAEGVIS